MSHGHAINGTLDPATAQPAGQPAQFVAPHQIGTVPAHAALPAASPIPVPEPAVHRLPSGHTVSVASARILTRGQRMRLVELVRDADNVRAGGIATTNAMFTWMIAGWSYPFPIPAADPASLDLIPAEDDDVLLELIVPPVNKLLFPKAPSVDDHADPASPTAPSGE